MFFEVFDLNKVNFEVFAEEKLVGDAHFGYLLYFDLRENQVAAFFLLHEALPHAL